MNITLRDYSFKVDPGKNKLIWEEINKGNWESHSFDIFDYFVPKNGNVIDIGAWSGVLSLYIAHKAHKTYAIDPDPICFDELQKNIALNPAISSKISAHQIAISEKKEIVNLSARLAYGESSSSILKRRRDTENSFQLTTVPLLDFLIQEQITQIDFIKMDVEGAEFSILPTLGDTLKKINYPTLYVSFHYHFLIEQFYYEYISSSFLNKVLIKLETIVGFSLFKSKIQTKIANLFDSISSYTYIYTTDGNLITLDFLTQHSEFIKEHDLVFTNQKWEK